jgi:hypothetical protein
VLVQPDLPDELHGTLGIHRCTRSGRAVRRARDAGAQVLGAPHDALDGTLRGYSARDPEGDLSSFGTDRPGG